MTEQRTPDALSTQAENELICEKLLAWKRCPSCGEQQWYCNYDRRDPTSGPFKTCVTPSFTTWAEAGLILEAIPKDLEYVVGYCDIEKQWYCGQAVGADTYADTGPLAVRAAALQYVKGEL